MVRRVRLFKEGDLVTIRDSHGGLLCGVVIQVDPYGYSGHMTARYTVAVNGEQYLIDENEGDWISLGDCRTGYKG